MTRTEAAAPKISVQLRDDNGSTASLTFDATAICADDKWHHIAFTRDYAGVANLYLDGKVMATKTSAELVTPPTPAKVTCKFSIGTRLGNNGWGTYPYRGQLAQVSLWGRGEPDGGPRQGEDALLRPGHARHRFHAGHRGMVRSGHGDIRAVVWHGGARMVRFGMESHRLFGIMTTWRFLMDKMVLAGLACLAAFACSAVEVTVDAAKTRGP